MLPADRQILDHLARNIRELEPRARVWAYGSRARGTADEYSDFDVFIVVPEVTGKLLREIRDRAWEIAFDNGTVIPTVVLSEDEFENGPMSASTLVANIHREGIAA